MNVRKLSALALTILLTPSIAWSATVALPASKDTSIFSESTSNSGGGSPGIFAGNNGSGGIRRGLIAFDLSSIPAGSTITQAELKLYVGNAPGSSPAQTVSIFPLTKNWGEGTTGSSNPTLSGGGGGAAAVAPDATWANAATPSTPWATAGGDFAGVASASVGSITATTNTPYIWSSAAMVTHVQGWLDNPATNFGWILRNASDAGSQTVRGFYSRESGTGASSALTTAFQPSLSITYVPEPASAVLLLFAGQMLLLRRRSFAWAR